MASAVIDDVRYADMSKEDRQKVRKEMFRQAADMLRDMGFGREDARSTANKMVAAALEKERRGDGNTEGSNPQRVA